MADGTAFRTEGTAALRVRYRARGADRVLEGSSPFLRHEGAWAYLDALPSR